ncbi:ATP-binding protein [Chthoniobacter flavus]|nr:ATP-binding protein [Chthoniobacter flavus]
MSILASTIHRGPLVRAQKTVIYGPEGIGKTTLAAQFPSPVFLDTEGGTHHLDVARFPAPKTWDDVTKTIAALASEPHEFRTLVVDTADWLEKLLIEDVCRRANKTSIEEFGYGKGYVVLAEEVTKFLASLNALLARGMHVLLLAHCRIAKFEQPDAAGAYDRYELKLTKQVAPLVKEWCDMLLFANYFTKIAENDSGRNAVSADASASSIRPTRPRGTPRTGTASRKICRSSSPPLRRLSVPAQKSNQWLRSRIPSRGSRSWSPEKKTW